MTLLAIKLCLRLQPFVPSYTSFSIIVFIDVVEKMIGEVVGKVVMATAVVLTAVVSTLVSLVVKSIWGRIRSPDGGGPDQDHHCATFCAISKDVDGDVGWKGCSDVGEICWWIKVCWWKLFRMFVNVNPRLGMNFHQHTISSTILERDVGVKLSPTYKFSTNMLHQH